MITCLRRPALILAAMCLCLLSACATVPPGATARLTLSQHEFEAWSFVPRAGDPIEIDNRSDIAHSIYITYPDGSVVNLGTQLPGAVLRWTPPHDGVFVLRCWIHPVIRADLRVGVSPAADLAAGGGGHHGGTHR
jgi:hypothetical protein